MAFGAHFVGKRYVPKEIYRLTFTNFNKKEHCSIYFIRTFAFKMSKLRMTIASSSTRNQFFSSMTALRKGLLVIACLMVWFLSQPLPVAAQDVKPETGDSLQASLYVKVSRTEYKGDSIPNVTLHEFYRFSPRVFKNDRERERYNRMVNNIKKVYPLAQLVRETLIETHDILETLPTKKEKQDHIDRVEKCLKEQYTPVVKKLSRSQGRLLVKLIDRECGQTSYEMVQAFIGPLRAGVYQVLAGLFGNSLTKHYDPEGDDRFTERIVKMVESGQI